MIDDALKPVKFTMNNGEARVEPFTHRSRYPTEVLFEQLNMDVQRAQWITDLVRQARQEALQQVSLFRYGRLRCILAERLCQNMFHWLTR